MGDLVSKYGEIYDMTTSKTFNSVGRPFKFTKEEFEKRIMKFFEFCEEKKKPLTIGRLACFLDCNRQTLLEYKHKDQFTGTLKKLRMAIEAEKNENLIGGKGSTIGLIFDLKNNHDWKDKQEIETTGDGPVNIIIKEGNARKMKDITPVVKKIEVSESETNEDEE